MAETATKKLKVWLFWLILWKSRGRKKKRGDYAKPMLRKLQSSPPVSLSLSLSLCLSTGSYISGEATFYRKSTKIDCPKGNG